MACIQSSEGLQNSGLLHPDQRGEPSPFLSKQPWEPWNFYLIFVLLWISTSGVCPAKYV